MIQIVRKRIPKFEAYPVHSLLHRINTNRLTELPNWLFTALKHNDIHVDEDDGIRIHNYRYGMSYTSGDWLVLEDNGIVGYTGQQYFQTFEEAE